MADHLKDFEPKSLQSLDFGPILKTLLDNLQIISEKMSEAEKNQLKMSIDLEAVTKAIAAVQLSLTNEILHPKTGVIALVSQHEKFLSLLEKERVLETVRDNSKVIATLTRLFWLGAAAIIGLGLNTFMELIGK